MKPSDRKALDIALELITVHPDRLIIDIRWQRGEWECGFTNFLDRRYEGRNADLAAAIHEAIDTLHKCEEVGRNHEAIKASHMAILANSKPFNFE